MFELKARSGQKANDKNKVCKYGIDGRRYRNIGPFFNHACSGFNIEPRFLYSEHHDKDIPTVAFFAKRNIKPNEEILLNYGHKLPGCRCCRVVVRSENFLCVCSRVCVNKLLSI